MSSRMNFTMAAALLAFTALVLAVPFAAQAAGTASGTPITNTATVEYSVGSVTQPLVSTGPTGTFVVDTKVNLTVQRVDASYVTSVPSGTTYLTFRVVNNGNNTQDFAVSAATPVADPFGGTDNFDANNVQVFVDTDGNGVYSAATDTMTFIDNLVSDATATVFIVANMPVGQANNSIAAYGLLATTHDAGAVGTLGALTNETAGAGTLTGVDVVFADAGNAANVPADTPRDGEASDRGAFQIVTATISIVKSAATYSDPFNGTSNPKAIPGAVMTYTIAVQNTGAANATNVVITDNLAALPVTFATQFNDGTDNCSGGFGIVVNNTCNSNNADADNGSFAGNTVTVNGLTINAGATATIKFQVTIN